MRRVILAGLLAVLAALTAARAAVERPAAEAAAAVHWDQSAYNVVEMDMPARTGTAGSTLIAALDSYFRSRVPTEKGDCTGLLAGYDLILLLADGLSSDAVSQESTPALWRLWTEGVRFRQVYAPDWYQGADGRLFALLTGMTPTVEGESSSLAWAGQQGTYLPFALGTCLAGQGYDCRIWPERPEQSAACAALGFAPQSGGADGGEALAGALADRGAAPVALCLAVADGGAEQTVDRLWRLLEQNGRINDTAVCLVAWGQGEQSSLFLWADGLAGREVACPCSELDVTPTLLNLLGVDYDSRFLSGRDVLARDAGSVPVGLSGSAYAGWVTDAGRYDPQTEQFSPADSRFSGRQEIERYVSRMRRAVYEQYVCAREIMECDYFRVRMGG